MTLSEILQDIHALQEDLLLYEHKYNLLSEIFYESYLQGDEPPDDAWVMDWVGWAGTYKVWLERTQCYHQAIDTFRQSMTLLEIIEKAARRELLPVAV